MSTSTYTRPMYSNSSYPVTEKQQSFIEKLLSQKDLTGTAYEGWTPDWSRATKSAASSVIDYLLTLPARRAVAAAPKPEPEAGIYQVPFGETYRVYLGQHNGRMLVKRVDFHADGPAVNWDDVPLWQVETVAEQATGHVTYEYLGTAAKALPKDAKRLSIEEVGKLGKSWDSCLICGRRLDDPESVDRGIGPVCAAKY